MATQSQPKISESPGRVNQKRRTRAAIIAAGKAVLDRGETPTIARVAEEALMTRPTVYRYFPTQDSLLLELTLTTGIDEEFSELLARPLGKKETPQDRILLIIDELNQYCLDNEALFRNALRHYQEMWLATEREGGEHGQLREGRRLTWIRTILEPLRSTLPAAEMSRLERALCLVVGGEAITVLRDVCGIDDAREARAVARFAGEAILRAAFDRR